MTPAPACHAFAEAAALYAAGALPPDERAALEQHAAACAACRAQLDSYGPAVAALADAAGAVEPPPAVRARLLARLAESGPGREFGPTAQVWKQWTGPAQATDLYIARAGDTPWDETGVAGVAVRRLFVNRANNQVTMLVRMTPGAAYPGHRHDGAEECYVLEGDLRVGDEVLHAGDYQHAPVGSRHGVQYTEHGCLLLIVSSLTDELD